MGFSEDRNEIDEHAYQIGELGKFDLDKSLDDDIVVGINKDTSVDFSDEEGDALSHEAVKEKSMTYSSDEANELADEDYFSSDLDEKEYKYPHNYHKERHYEAEPAYYRHHDDDEWQKFVEEEKLHTKPAAEEEPKH